MLSYGAPEMPPCETGDVKRPKGLVAPVKTLTTLHKQDQKGSKLKFCLDL